MPAKDIYHDSGKQALIKDGWHISHDPYNLKIGRKDLFIDLAGEKLITAEKDTQKIAVESKALSALLKFAILKQPLVSTSYIKIF